MSAAKDTAIAVIKGYIARQIDAQSARIDQMQEQLRERAKDGAPGKDGQDGADGKSVDAADIVMIVQDAVAKAVAAIPPARDGKDGRDGLPGVGMPGDRGKDGRDALDGLIDIEASLEHERELSITFVRSNGEHRMLRALLPIPIFRGVHQEGRSYLRGDNVTRNGCQWTCMADTTSTPPSVDWVQSTKAGRDGRDK